MEKNRFNGKRGTAPKLLSKFINNNLNKTTNKNANNKKRDVKKASKLGRLKSPDIRDISIGTTALRRMIQDSLEVFRGNILTGKNKDVNTLEKGIIDYSDSINIALQRLDHNLQDKSNLKERVIELRKNYRIAQAARDGILIKQDERVEIDENGEERKIKFDIAMTENEVIRTLEKYNELSVRYRYNEVCNYVDIGTSVLGALGMIISSFNSENKKIKSNYSIVSTGIMAVSIVRLLGKRFLEKINLEEKKIRDDEGRKAFELLNNEQISYNAEQDALLEIEKLSKDSTALHNKEENIKFGIDGTLSIITAIVTGMYVTNMVKSKGKNKLDRKTFSEAMSSLSTTKGYVGGILSSVIRMQDNSELKDEVKYLAGQVEEIEKQMKEKVYPLKGATKSFNSFEITNLDGNFYPTKDYETGKINYGTKIKVPEFSIKRGETVLLTGDSGAGKSTFLRLLKRGDINNRNPIKLDNGEKVDNLGKEYISFKPSTELGEEETVLNQITGKKSLKDLSLEERENLTNILKELNLYNEGILSEIASKKIKQFSTGQQRRLSLSKLFYRIKDSTSVIIVDEPVRKC